MTISIRFDKMQGAGNDFILIDNRAGVVPDDRKSGFAKRFCRRAMSVGADGLILLEHDPEFDCRWSFFNADGSVAEMCGNGARCMAVFARKIGAATKDSLTFRTLAGPIRATLVPGGARLGMTDATVPVLRPKLPVNGRALDAWFLNTGVPHAIVPVESLDAVDVKADGAALRHHEAFKPAGTNANFMAKDGAGVAIRTYERGVEDETLACGTGSVAAAIVAAALYGLSSPVAVRTRSGAVLRIGFAARADRIADVTLEGPAELVYEGRFDWDGQI